MVTFMKIKCGNTFGKKAYYQRVQGRKEDWIWTSMSSFSLFKLFSIFEYQLLLAKW